MKSAAVVLASSVLVVPVLITACSGSTVQDLFAPQTGSSATDPHASGSNGSSGSSGSASESGSSGSSGSSGESGTEDAGPDTAAWKSPGIFCGAGPGGADVYCPPSTQFCCSRNQGGDAPRFDCISSTTPGQCNGGATIRCDDRTDCPNHQICCGSFDPINGYRGVQCQKTCSSLPGSTAVRFCDGNAPIDECAENGMKCTPSGGLEGFHVCE